MKAYKKCIKSKITTHRREYKIVTDPQMLDPYWDEGVRYHRSKGRRRKNKKEILAFQVRMYKTWKHNRLTQWK